MPVGDRKAQMVFHALSQHNFIRIIVAECQRVVAVRSFIFNLLNVAEKSGAHCVLPFECRHVWLFAAASLTGEGVKCRIKGVITLIGFLIGREQGGFRLYRAFRARRRADGKWISAGGRNETSRAAPKAPPKSPSSGKAIGTFNAVAIAFSQ